MMCTHCSLSIKPAHANAVVKNRAAEKMVMCAIIARFAPCNIKAAVDLGARIFILVEDRDGQNDNIEGP